MTCLLASEPQIIETAHPKPWGSLTYLDKKIGLFSRVIVQLGLELTPMPDKSFAVSAPEKLYFIYEH